MDPAVRGHGHDFPASQLPLIHESQLLIRKALKGNGVSVVPPADFHGQPARPVPRGNQMPLLGQDQDGRRPLDRFLREPDPFGEVALLVNQGRQQLRLVDPSAGHGIKMPAAERQILVDQRLSILNDPGHADGVGSQG